MSAAVVAAMCLLTGCSFPAPIAFRLTNAGNIDIAFCSEASIDKVEVSLEEIVWPVVNPGFNPDFRLLSENPIAIDKGYYVPLVKSDLFSVEGDLDLSADGWNRIDVEASENDLTLFGSIDRNKLIVDEWVWNSEQVDGAAKPCNAPKTPVGTGQQTTAE